MHQNPRYTQSWVPKVRKPFFENYPPPAKPGIKVAMEKEDSSDDGFMKVDVQPTNRKEVMIKSLDTRELAVKSMTAKSFLRELESLPIPEFVIARGKTLKNLKDGNADKELLERLEGVEYKQGIIEKGLRTLRKVGGGKKSSPEAEEENSSKENSSAESKSPNPDDTSSLSWDSSLGDLLFYSDDSLYNSFHSGHPHQSCQHSASHRFCSTCCASHHPLTHHSILSPSSRLHKTCGHAQGHKWCAGCCTCPHANIADNELRCSHDSRVICCKCCTCVQDLGDYVITGTMKDESNGEEEERRKIIIRQEGGEDWKKFFRIEELIMPVLNQDTSAPEANTYIKVLETSVNVEEQAAEAADMSKPATTPTYNIHPDIAFIPFHAPDCQCDELCAMAMDKDQVAKPGSSKRSSENGETSSEDEERVGEPDQLGLAASAVAIMVAMMWWMENKAHFLGPERDCGGSRSCE